MDVRVVLDVDPEMDMVAGDRLARQLRHELAELDIESIRNAPAPQAPEHSKTGAAVTTAEIILTLSASGGVVTTTIATLRAWLERHALNHRIRVTIDEDVIELDKATAAQRQALVDAYIRRHTTD